MQTWRFQSKWGFWVLGKSVISNCKQYYYANILSNRNMYFPGKIAFLRLIKTNYSNSTIIVTGIIVFIFSKIEDFFFKTRGPFLTSVKDFWRIFFYGGYYINQGYNTKISNIQMTNYICLFYKTWYVCIGFKVHKWWSLFN